MPNAPENISQIFTLSSSIRIPPYQRAYSWETKQYTQFIDDILVLEGKKYYLGQFLFEREDETLYIIDGQQRITTTIIFISAIARVLANRGHNTDAIKQTYLTDIFKTIKDDQRIFKRITRDYRIPGIDDARTLSQRRIISAFSYFDEKLKIIDSPDKLKLILTTLTEAIVSTFYISNKIEATQVFEYQNNRGKELSRFEVIKAFLMNQVYINSNCADQATSTIGEIEINISIIYRSFEKIEGFFTENDIIDNYCGLFFNTEGNIEAIKDVLAKLSNQTNKSTWITSFFENLADLASDAENIVNNKNQPEIANLFFVGNEANWKLVLLALYYKADNKGDVFKCILKLLEVLCFKLKLGDYRTDLLPRYAKKYFNADIGYNIDSLRDDICNAATKGFQWYWNDNGRFEKIVDSFFDSQRNHYTPKTIKYVLWQYENSLRIKNSSGVLLDKNQYDDYTIEHIRPQNPATPDTDDFVNKYLNLAGNLSLLMQSQNSRFSNKSFQDKKELYQDTALSNYAEIRTNTQWTETEIDERHTKISGFAKKYFDITAIKECVKKNSGS